MKIVFFGTPAFAIPALKKLTEPGHEISAVFSQPDKPSGRGLQVHATPVKTFAIKHRLPVYQPEKIRNNEAVKRTIASLDPEIIVVAAYGKILPKWLLDLPKYGAVNIHASLLPKYRGAAPIPWAIIHGEKVTGVTIMQMDDQMDTGDILLQEKVEILPEETAGELHDRLAVLGAELLVKALRSIAEGTIRPLKQDARLASLAPRLEKDAGKINWHQKAEVIHNLIRGLNPWPGAFTFFRGEQLHIWSSRVADKGSKARNHKFDVGHIVEVEQERIIVQCGESTYLSVLELQMPNRKRLPVKDFINGVKIDLGDRFT